MTTFERIKQVANERGFNLKQTALMAGLSENALYRYNQGVEPKYATVKAVADVLGVSVDYLLGNTDDMHANKKSTDTEPIDIKKVAKNDAWDDYLSSDGRPLTEHDKKLLRAIFGD